MISASQADDVKHDDGSVSLSVSTVGTSFLRVTNKTKEVDFYRNPTILSRLILNHKYSSAIKRVRNRPEEVSVWVGMKRDPSKREECMKKFMRRDKSTRIKRRGSGDSSLSSDKSTMSMNSHVSQLSYYSQDQQKKMIDYSLRQLPIHSACGNLSHCVSHNRPKEELQELETLIMHLIVMYPESCSQPDHDGKIPLHEAIYYNASSETISMMLMAAPSSIHMRDRFGRAPADLNRICSGPEKDKINEMLMKGESFWERARAEAVARTSTSNPGGDDGSASSGDSTNSGDRGAGGHSASVGRDGGKVGSKREPSRADRMLEDAASVASSLSSTFQGKKQSRGGSVIEPMSWVKLEKKVFYLEQLLTGMYEKNYELGETVEELTRERLSLQEQADHCRKYHSMFNESNTEESASIVASQLREENNNLKNELARGLTKVSSKSNDVAQSQLSAADSAGGVRVVNSSTKYEYDDNGNAESKFSKDMLTESEVSSYFDDRNSQLEHDVDSLNETLKDYQDKINRLELTIASLRGQQEQRGDNPDTFTMPHGSQGLKIIPEENPLESNVGASSKSTAQEDLDCLLETLKTESRFATERYLAGKVLDLEEKLESQQQARESDIGKTTQENIRLLEENQALQDLVRRLTGKHSGIGADNSNQEHSKQSTNQSSSINHDIFQSDDLEEILRGAANVYDGRSVRSAASTKYEDDMEMALIRDELDDIEEMYGKSIPEDLKIALSRASLVSGVPISGLGSTSDEKVRHLIQETEELYGQPVPPTLVTFLKKYTPNNTVDDKKVDKMFAKAASIYGRPIPHGLLTAMKSSRYMLTNQNGSDSTPPTEKKVEDMLNRTAEVYGAPIPKDLRRAMLQSFVSDVTIDHAVARTVSNSSPGTSSRNEIKNRSQKGGLARNDLGDSFNNINIDDIIGEAEAMYGIDIPSDLKTALHNANVSVSSELIDEESLFSDKSRFKNRSVRSYALEEAVNKGNWADAVAAAGQYGDSSRSVKTFSTYSSNSSTLDRILLEAERTYGKPLPADMRLALRDTMAASIGDEVSFFSKGGTTYTGTRTDDDSYVSRDTNSFISRDTRSFISRDDPSFFSRGDSTTYFSKGTSSAGMNSKSDGTRSTTDRSSTDESDGRSHKSDAQTFVGDSDDDLERIIQEAERNYGQKLPEDIMKVLRDDMTVGSDFTFNTSDLLSTAHCDADSVCSSIKTSKSKRSTARNEITAPISDFVSDDINEILAQVSHLYDGSGSPAQSMSQKSVKRTNPRSKRPGRDDDSLGSDNINDWLKEASKSVASSRSVSSSSKKNKSAGKKW